MSSRSFNSTSREGGIYILSDMNVTTGVTAVESRKDGSLLSPQSWRTCGIKARCLKGGRREDSFVEDDPHHKTLLIEHIFGAQ